MLNRYLFCILQDFAIRALLVCPVQTYCRHVAACHICWQDLSSGIWVCAFIPLTADNSVLVKLTQFRPSSFMPCMAAPTISCISKSSSSHIACALKHTCPAQSSALLMLHQHRSVVSPDPNMWCLMLHQHRSNVSSVANMWYLMFCRCSNIQSWKDPDRWITAAQDVQLSVEQKGDFMGLRRACLEKLKE